MRVSRIALSVGVIVAAVLESSYAGPTATSATPARSSIPYVATRHDAVRDMLWLANVGKDDVVYDLGSGDGRIVIAAVREFGVRRAVGIEDNLQRVRESQNNASKAGVMDRVEFIQGDLFSYDFHQATVLMLYLGHQPNIDLRPKILSTMKPGTRVVSHQFGMGEWQPDKMLTVHTVFLGMWGTAANPFGANPRVPDYTGYDGVPGRDTISMWVVPAQVAGVWRGKIETSDGLQNFKLILHQRLSAVSGKFQVSGASNLEGWVHADLWGDHLRYECKTGRMFRLMFDGHVSGGVLRGTLAVSEGDKTREGAWEAQRDNMDLTGTWVWRSSSDSHPVKLCIERHDEQLSATYVDGTRIIPVTDFYDFGGGFYFTLKIGREGNSIVVNDGIGWLIGEGIVDDGALKGRIEFYPYGQYPDIPEERTATPRAIQDWAPQRIQP